jgi:hypothetical protein
MVKNNLGACLISKKLDFASPLKTESALNPQLTVNMPMDNLSLES